jgi:hypothetical protein
MVLPVFSLRSPQSDRDLERRVILFLTGAGSVEVSQLRIRARGGEVTVRGTVGSLQALRLVEVGTRRVAGVRALNIQLNVVAPCLQAKDSRPKLVLAPNLIRHLGQRNLIARTDVV